MRRTTRLPLTAALANKKYGVAVKCATITPNAARMTEYNLKEMWKSPNGTIRAIMDGTVFRTPIVVKGIEPCVRNWKKPITLARHAYGDVYKASEIKVPGAGKAELVFTAEDGTETRELIHEFDGPGVLQGMHNTDEIHPQVLQRAASTMHWIPNRICGLLPKIRFPKNMTIPSRIFSRKSTKKNIKKRFAEAGITYFYTLIDDAVARVMKAEGGFIWACKNYDGDVMSDMVSSAFGSLAMMTSVLVSPDGNYRVRSSSRNGSASLL